MTKSKDKLNNLFRFVLYPLCWHSMIHTVTFDGLSAIYRNIADSIQIANLFTYYTVRYYGSTCATPTGRLVYKNIDQLLSIFYLHCTYTRALHGLCCVGFIHVYLLFEVVRSFECSVI